MKKLLLVGSITQGFEIKSVETDAATAEHKVIALMAEGKMAEAVDVEDPKSLQPSAKVDPDGDFFVVYGKGLRDGFTVYGPFEDFEPAERFAERNRRADEEWEIFIAHETV